MKTLKHSPLVQGNPGGYCPELGVSFLDEETGQEWEICPVCGETGKVYVLGPESVMTLGDIAKEFIENFKKNSAELEGKK